MWKKKLALDLWLAGLACWQSSHWLLEHPHSVLTLGHLWFWFCLFANNKILCVASSLLHSGLFLELTHVVGWFSRGLPDWCSPLFQKIGDRSHGKWRGGGSPIPGCRFSWVWFVSDPLLGLDIRDASSAPTSCRIGFTVGDKPWREGSPAEQQIIMKWNIWERGKRVCAQPELVVWLEQILCLTGPRQLSYPASSQGGVAGHCAEDVTHPGDGYDLSEYSFSGSRPLLCLRILTLQEVTVHLFPHVRECSWPWAVRVWITWLHLL